jgi:hypothetical protein
VIRQSAAATTAGSQVSQQATPSTPALAAAEVSSVVMAEKLGTGYSAIDTVVPDVINWPAAQPGTTGGASEILIPDVVHEPAAPAAVIAPPLGTGDHLGSQIVVDEPAALTTAAPTEIAGADLAPNTMSMSLGIINAHEPTASTTSAPEVIVLVPDADAQVPPDLSATR